MDRLKNYMHDFWNDESGMELLQLAIVIVITVGLIGVMTTVMNTMASCNNSIPDSSFQKSCM